MNVGKICTRNVITVRESDELTTAAELMRENHIGYLVVVEKGPDPSNGHGKPVGVLTDRDIVVSVVSRKADPALLRVGDVMTREPLVVEEGLSVGSALVQMRKNGIRRIPVIAPAGHLSGVLSLDDVLDVLANELNDVAGSIRNEQRIEGVLLR